MTDDDDDDANAMYVLRIAEQIKPHLAGQGAAVQGAVLAELLSIWLAGHPKPVRDMLLDVHIAAVRQLIPCNTNES
jgi:hypothetical protein